MSLTVYVTTWVLTGFLAGSIPFGWLVTRAAGIDIRKVGSGNIGGTNVWRAMGWRWGMTVLLLDVIKGLLPVLALILCMAHMPGGRLPAAWIVPLKMLVGLAAVLGHTFTPWLGFRGGKGVATGLGVTLALYQGWIVVPLLLFGVVLLTTRMVSFSSILAALMLAALATLPVPEMRALWPFGLLAALLVVWTHRSNIERIFSGTENQISFRRKRQEKAEEQDNA